MNEPKVGRTYVDAERLVRELRDALKSLKTIPAPPTHSSPSEERRQQRTLQPQENGSKVSDLVDCAQSKVPGNPQPGPRTVQEPLTGPVADADEGEPKQISAFGSAENSKLPDNRIDAQPSQYEIIEGFCSIHETIERLRVTRREFKALSGAALLGSLTCKRDLLVVLQQIGGPRKLSKLQATEPLRVSDESIESSIQDVSEMAERIRRDALARLTESDSLRGVDRRSLLRQIVVFSALFLMAAMTGICMNWVHHLWPETGNVLL